MLELHGAYREVGSDVDIRLVSTLAAGPPMSTPERAP